MVQLLKEVDAAPTEANTSWSSGWNKMLKTESTLQQDDEILEEQTKKPRNLLINLNFINKNKITQFCTFRIAIIKQRVFINLIQLLDNNEHLIEKDLQYGTAYPVLLP